MCFIQNIARALCLTEHAKVFTCIVISVSMRHWGYSLVSHQDEILTFCARSISDVTLTSIESPSQMNLVTEGVQILPLSEK